MPILCLSEQVIPRLIFYQGKYILMLVIIRKGVFEHFSRFWTIVRRGLGQNPPGGPRGRFHWLLIGIKSPTTPLSNISCVRTAVEITLGLIYFRKSFPKQPMEKRSNRLLQKRFNNRNQFVGAPDLKTFSFLVSPDYFYFLSPGIQYHLQ